MDIDSDYCIYRGPEVFQHLIDKYGQSHVANVATFGRLQSKQVIKDIAKSFSIPFKEVNDFTRSIPDRKADGEPIKSFADVEETIEAQEFFKKYPEIAIYARKIEGLPRHISQHPAGIGVTPCDITDLIPVQLAKPNGPNLQPGFLAQYEKDNFEQAGVVKIDILKLKAATQIQQMINMLNTTYKDEILDKFGKLITDEDIPMDDEKAWDLLCEGDALGIFQMEKEIGINTLKKVQPRNITELAAVTSFIRPGAAGLENYLETKKEPSKRVRYDPRLDKYLDSTFGAVAFQEQMGR